MTHPTPSPSVRTGTGDEPKQAGAGGNRAAENGAGLPGYSIGEICADCGKEIGMLEASYYKKDPTCDIGKTYHAMCGDPFGIAAKVAAEREACAEAAFMALRDHHILCAKEAAAAIRARAAEGRKP